MPSSRAPLSPLSLPLERLSFSLSFVFAVTTQEVLGSCIFLFVKHPYDVGDRVDVMGTAENSSLIVEKISLLYTVFKRLDNQQILQVLSLSFMRFAPHMTSVLI